MDEFFHFYLLPCRVQLESTEYHGTGAYSNASEVNVGPVIRTLRFIFDCTPFKYFEQNTSLVINIIKTLFQKISQ